MWGKKKAEPELVDLDVPGAAPVLEDPGTPISMTVKVDSDGHINIRYIGEPSWAVETLRTLADQVEAETSGQSDPESS